MIVPSLLCYLTVLSLYGYSYIYKRIENKNKIKVILNEDIFYGILTIVFLSLLINLFVPLKYFTFIIFILGLVFFIIGNKKKIYQIKFHYYFYLILIINFISFYNGPNVDSALYHLQTINWMILNKINLGISNLNYRFGSNSSWHSFLALTNISFLNLQLKFYLSTIIFAILSYSIFFKKKYFISDLYLFLSISFLLTYTFIHPFVNGPILNQLGNPEVDIVAMFLFIYCFYYFLKFHENDFKINNVSINLIIVVIFLAITIKISNISLMFLLFTILLFNKNYKFINFSSIFITLTGLLWLVRSFLISGCFFFPIKKTCIDTPWTDFIETGYYAKVIQSFTRDTRLRERWTDFDHTLYSNDWFVPWFEDYFLNTAILKISSILLLISLIIFLSILGFEYFFKKKKSSKSKKYFFIIVTIFFLISIYIWLKAPEVRFGSGLIISLPCFFLAVLLDKLRLNKYFTNRNILIAIFGLFSLIILKHSNKFDLKHLIVINKGNYVNFEHIKKIADIDGVEIYYSVQSKCGDFPKICVNTKKKSYEIIQKYNYRIFLNTSRVKPFLQ